MRRAVYMCIGGYPTYVRMLALAVASTRAWHSSDSDLDVVVMCDAGYVRYVSEVPGITRVVVTETNTTGKDASARKLDLFATDPSIGTYDAVMYLDCDIIATARLDGMFADILDPPPPPAAIEPPPAAGPPAVGLHVVTETCAPGDHRVGYSDTRGSTEPFNAGTFGFVPCAEIAAGFARARAVLAARGGFWEQSALNHAFRHGSHDGGGIAVHHTLTRYVRLGALGPRPPREAVVHFADCDEALASKLAKMTALFGGNAPGGRATHTS